jgi:hypothetical protein
MKPALLSLTALSAAVSLVSCAPAASEFSVSHSSARNSATRAPRYPFKAGQVWTLSGADQNRNTLRSKLTLSDREPSYRTSSDGRGIWLYQADNGYIVLYELAQGTRFVVWDDSDPKRLLACYVPATYNDSQSSYEGAALSGSQAEISGTFAKLGNSVVGGDCRATRS